MKTYSSCSLIPISRLSFFTAIAVLLSACGGSNEADHTDTTSAANAEVASAGSTRINARRGAVTTANSSTAAPECGSARWVAGTSYSAGNIVMYPANGKYYLASHNNPGYDPTISTWYWDLYSCPTTTTAAPTATLTPTVTPTNNSTVVAGSSVIVTEAQFNKMFPNKNSFYTYAGFVAAVNSYPGMFNLGSDELRKQEAAAFLANVNHETGGLQYIRESNTANWPLYCDSGNQYKCAPNQQYYGRGPIQLSWNYNYGAAGAALGLNLLADPDMVARDSTVAWKTAMWFWMTQKGGAQMTPHDAMVNLVGFAETIRAINGGLECNKPGGSVGNTQMQTRVKYYQNFASILGVPTGNNLTC